MTNADKIRSMGDVELYELLSYIFDSGVVDGFEYAHNKGRFTRYEWTLTWLAQEVD